MVSYITGRPAEDLREWCAAGRCRFAPGVGLTIWPFLGNLWKSGPLHRLRVGASNGRVRVFMDPVLVTGGCGFIGTNFIQYLLETDPEVRILNVDLLTYAGNPANLADLAIHPRYRFVQADIGDREAIRRIVGGGIQALFNFAAESHV